MARIKISLKEEGKVMRARDKDYAAVFFSLDGDWVIDERFSGGTIDRVWDRIADRGSMWYFYPIPGVVEIEPNQKSFDESEKVVDLDMELSGELRYFGERLIEEIDLPATVGEISSTLEKIYKQAVEEGIIEEEE